ncbi:receptor-type tyrosine-protein phosphatase O-like [Salvelinus alpinus]|uniref:receptor-type tyrosine-protein phosphatase O-like n=1 Tax=Salvelinus alpinus TaxID=8036 RepID=UPI0039FD56CE
MTPGNTGQVTTTYPMNPGNTGQVTTTTQDRTGNYYISHEPRQHRTVPNPPLNISHNIVPLSQRVLPGGVPGSEATQDTPRRARDVPLVEEQELQENQEIQEVISEEVVGGTTQVSYSSAPQGSNSSTGYATSISNNTEEETATQPYWPESYDSPSPTDGEEEFVNAVVPEYEDSNEPGSAMGLPPETSVTPTRFPPVLLELRWLPPRPPTTYDGFNVYIYRDSNSTETATVDENTHEFFTELTEPGTYRVQVTTLSSAGDCEARESIAYTGFTFYLSMYSLTLTLTLT